MVKDGRKDEVSGANTTGHEWDGIEELNIPAPRWWLITWLITIIYSVGYMFFYPTWPVPGGHTEGSLGWTSVKQLEESMEEIRIKKAKYIDQISKAESLEDIRKNEELYEFAIAGGKSAFALNCSTCHGSGAAGAKGYPNLNDDDWLWGGSIEDIKTTLLYGIRSEHEDARTSEMPAFGKDEILTSEEISKVADFVISLSTGEGYNDQGKEIFADNCASCHGVEGKGDRDFGAPNLTDPIWLFGSDKENIVETISYSRKGVMPAWKDKLDEETIKQLTLYVHSLGGGE